MDLNTYLRPELREFAIMMEDRFRQKDEEKGPSGWSVMESVTPLLLPIAGKYAGFLRNLVMKGPDVIKCVIDLANYLMIVLNVLGKKQ